MMSIASDQSCPKCGSHCFGKCYEEVNAAQVGEDWYYVGSPIDGDRPEVLGMGVQCIGCGGVIRYDADRRVYVCAGYAAADGYEADEPGCGDEYRIGRHVAYDVIF